MDEDTVVQSDPRMSYTALGYRSLFFSPSLSLSLSLPFNNFIEITKDQKQNVKGQREKQEYNPRVEGNKKKRKEKNSKGRSTIGDQSTKDHDHIRL